MKNLLLFAFAACLAFAGCEKDPKPEPDVLSHISDPVFLACCQYAMENATTEYGVTYPAWDTDGNGKLSPTEAAAVTHINFVELRIRASLSSMAIFSLAGIEYFPGLMTLYCERNQLTSLDLSKNTALTDLNCTGNRLTSLDLSKNTALTDLDCVGNRLTSLDLSKNTVLTYLNCIANQLTSLDLSKNTALTYLICWDNQLTSLDISNNTALTALDCRHNPGNGTKFPVKAWFDNSSIPNDLPQDGSVRYSWIIDSTTITIYYQKVD